MTKCSEPLPCGITDLRWDEHVCRLPEGHEDVDSPCECAVCSPEDLKTIRRARRYRNDDERENCLADEIDQWYDLLRDREMGL